MMKIEKLFNKKKLKKDRRLKIINLELCVKSMSCEMNGYDKVMGKGNDDRDHPPMCLGLGVINPCQLPRAQGPRMTK